MDQTEVLKGGVEVIERISHEWSALCDEGASSVPFLRPEWFIAFVQNFEAEIELVTVRRNGRLRAVLPLVAKRSDLHGISAKSLQAVYNLNTQRFDLVHGSDESEKKDIIKAIWAVIKEHEKWSVLEMRLVRTDSWLASLVEIAEADSFRTGIWKMDSAPFIRLPVTDGPKCSINDFLKGSRKQLRQQLDRRKRRLDEIGELKLVLTRTYSPELIDRYLELETKGWKGRNGTSAVEDPNVARLHHDFAKAVSDTDALFAYELRLDEIPIAMSINIENGRIMFHWKTTFDEAYSKYSPGNLLFKLFVAECLERDIDEIDLMSPSTTNKRYWASGEKEHAAFYVFAPGLLGTFLWGWKFGVVALLRDLKSRTREQNMAVAVQKQA